MGCVIAPWDSSLETQDGAAYRALNADLIFTFRNRKLLKILFPYYNLKRQPDDMEAKKTTAKQWQESSREAVGVCSVVVAGYTGGEESRAGTVLCLLWCQVIS